MRTVSDLMEAKLKQTILETVSEFSTPKRPVYLVGGAVRDTLLDRPVHDLDFILPGETRGLAREVARRLDGALYTLDEERDTTRVVLAGEAPVGGAPLGEAPVADPGERILLDFASLRAGDLERDLRARDFTINAMAYDVARPDHLIDPAGGLADLRARRIRACSPTSLSRDPVRVLRAIRLALAFHFAIDPGTVTLIRAAAPLLWQPSAERLRDELFRMFEGSQVAPAVRLLDQVGALDFVLPELAGLKGVTQTAPHVSDVWEHTLSVVQYLEELLRVFHPQVLVGEYQQERVTDPVVASAVLWLERYRSQLAAHFHRNLVPDRSLRGLLFLAALYHDIAKPATRKEMPDGRVRFLEHPARGAEMAAARARALALSADEVARLERIIDHHMRVHFLANPIGGPGREPAGEKLSRRSIYRFFKDTGDAGIDICLLSLADLRGTYQVTLPQELWQAELETCRELFEAYWEQSEEVVSPPRFLTGNDVIQEFGLRPGRIVGRLLAAVREAQAAGEVHNRTEALAFARGWMERHAAAGETSREESEG